MTNEEKYKILLTMPTMFGYFASGKTYKSPKHIKYINNKIIKFLQNDKKILIITMPPRHGKSELISKYLPAWYLLRNPDKRVILSSYESSFAASWGRKVRDLIEEFGKIYGIQLDESSKSVSSFSIKGRKGGMITAGVGGAITGYGADLFIIDDPVKNNQEANSITYRDRAEDWFKSVAQTRLEPNGKIIIIMTRWHKDDLVGRIKERQKDYEIINLPAIAEKQDLLNRQEGEALWKERYPKSELMKIKSKLGEYFFNSLYQQSPSMTTKGLFKLKDMRYFKVNGAIELLNYDKETDEIYRLDEIEYKFATMDLAISEKDTADYTVLTVFGIIKDKLLILDMFRERIKPIEHVEKVKEYYYKHDLQVIYIEAVQYQMALLQQIEECGIPVKQAKANKSKFVRAIPLSAYLESGKVYFNLDLEQISEIENEMLEFPFGKHDDIVDTLAYGVEAFQGLTINKFDMVVI